LAFLLLLLGVRNQSPQAALGLDKESKRGDIRLDRTRLARTNEAVHHVEACYENVQHANASSLKPGSESAANKTKTSAECKPELLDTTRYEPLLNTNREVVQEATYEELKKPLNV
jgi:hypothetical protein